MKQTFEKQQLTYQCSYGKVLFYFPNFICWLLHTCILYFLSLELHFLDLTSTWFEVFGTRPGFPTLEAFSFSTCFVDVYWNTRSSKHSYLVQIDGGRLILDESSLINNGRNCCGLFWYYSGPWPSASVWGIPDASFSFFNFSKQLVCMYQAHSCYGFSFNSYFLCNTYYVAVS